MQGGRLEINAATVPLPIAETRGLRSGNPGIRGLGSLWRVRRRFQMTGSLCVRCGLRIGIFAAHVVKIVDLPAQGEGDLPKRRKKSANPPIFGSFEGGRVEEIILIPDS